MAPLDGVRIVGQRYLNRPRGLSSRVIGVRKDTSAAMEMYATSPGSRRALRAHSR